MAENPKYPQAQLADNDKKILDGVIVKYAVKFEAFKQKYPDPRAFVEKEIIKKPHSEVLGTLLTAAYAKNDPFNTIYEPGQLNQRLASDARTAKHDRESSIGCEAIEPALDKFLKPRGLREGVLKKAEDLNIFVHLKGKKEIKEHRRKIKKSDRKIGDRGGNPSAYMTTDDVVKINKVMAKTGAVDYFLEKMNGYGLGFALTKYMMQAFFYAAKMDKRMYTMTTVIGAKFMNDNITDRDKSNFEAAFGNLRLYSDGDLERMAENAALFLTSNRGFNGALIFFGAIIKLLNF